MGTEGRNCKTEISPAIALENVELEENVSSKSSDHGDWFEDNLSKKSSNQMWQVAEQYRQQQMQEQSAERR